MNREDITVLVVDDEEQLRRNLCFFLEDWEYEVVDVESGEEAIDSPNACNADVAIVDMRMKGMDGNQTVLALHERNQTMKFILHTGSTEYEIPDELQALGITEELLMHKPVLDMSLFCQTIDSIMGVEEL